MTVPARANEIFGTGEMADLTRAFDWSKTPVGPIAEWPDALLITVNTMLGTRLTNRARGAAPGPSPTPAAATPGRGRFLTLRRTRFLAGAFTFASLPAQDCVDELFLAQSPVAVDGQLRRDGVQIGERASLE